VWTEKDTLPLLAARYNATAFSVNGNIYVFGGWDDMNYLNDLWKYDTSTNHWTPMDTMPAAGREQSLSFVLNGEAYIVGGASAAGTLKEVWKYNVTNNTWLQLADFPGTNAPVGGAAFTISGKGYIVPANGTVECWEFDLVTGDIQAESKVSPMINVNPNPVVNISALDIPPEFISPYQIDIYSSYGKKIKSINTYNNKISLMNNDFSKGIYFLRVRDRMSRSGVINFIIQ
jgi:N-acetylneuraminic acid mutarotase